MARYPVPSHNPPPRNLVSRSFQGLEQAAGQTVEVGLATETNTAQPIDANPYARLVNFATETDTALAITVVQTYRSVPKIAQGKTPVERAQVLLGPRRFAGARSTTTAAAGLASETDTATATGKSKVKAVGLTSETDTAFAITALKTKAVGLATETDTATVTTVVKTKAVGLATETDTALSISSSVTSPPVPKVYRGKPQAEERRTLLSRVFFALDSPQQWVSVNQATETDTAQPIAKTKTKAIGLASETDEAFAVGKAKVKEIGIAVETDTTLAISGGTTPVVQPPKVVRGRVAHTTALQQPASRIAHQLADSGNGYAQVWDGVTPNTALRAGGTNRVPVARNVPSTQWPKDEPVNQIFNPLFSPGPFQITEETDTALSITAVKTKTLSLASETDSAFSLNRNKGYWTSTSQATTTEIALPITSSTAKFILVNQAVETDTALAVSGGNAPPQGIPVGVAIEIDSTLGIRVRQGSAPFRRRRFGRYGTRNQR